MLDDKRPEVQAQLDDAPLMVDHLWDSCKAYYDAVRQHLTDLGVTWIEAPKLVRGLDYYTRTTFEFVHDGLGSQSAIGGGGRYDGLSAALGGPDSPGSATRSGWTGRCWPCRRRGSTSAPSPACRRSSSRWARRPSGCCSAGQGAARRWGSPRTSSTATGLKGAMKNANRSGASHVVAGERDLAEGVVQLKDMRTGEQHAVPVGGAVRYTFVFAAEDGVDTAGFEKGEIKSISHICNV